MRFWGHSRPARRRGFGEEGAGGRRGGDRRCVACRVSSLCVSFVPCRVSHHPAAPPPRPRRRRPHAAAAHPAAPGIPARSPREPANRKRLRKRPLPPGAASRGSVLTDEESIVAHAAGLLLSLGFDDFGYVPFFTDADWSLKRGELFRRRVAGGGRQASRT